jgi:SAM-dependent methyltransferase
VEPERGGFYRRTLERLLAGGALTREMSVLVTCGGNLDRDVFRALGFEDVTITNLDERLGEDVFTPYRWQHGDAEALPFPDDSFDWAVVSAGLHHCRSPHRAVLEMYRVARRGLLGIESRDSLSMRLAARVGLVDDYEVTAVAAHRFAAGGVANTAVPNYVYRWTEREVEKTIAAHAPHLRHRFLYHRELEIPWSVVDAGGPARRIAFRGLAPAARAVARIVPSQTNLFAFAVVKPGLPEGLQPWLREGEAGPQPDEAWIRARYRTGDT